MVKAYGITDFIVIVLPWILSITTICVLWLAGNKNKWAWILGFGNQCFWLLWIFLSATWGLIPLNVVLLVTYMRNHVKWKE
jgi:hypothetical protein